MVNFGKQLFSENQICSTFRMEIYQLVYSCFGFGFIQFLFGKYPVHYAQNLYCMTILRWKEGTSPVHWTICYVNDSGPLSHRPWRMQTFYATFKHLLPMAPCSNILWDSESHFYSFAQFPALSHSKYTVIRQSAQLMNFWFDCWTSIGVSASLIIWYSIWKLLQPCGTCWRVFLSVTLFLIKNKDFIGSFHNA